MPVTRQELDSFHSFAAAKLGQIDQPETMQECLNQWRCQREYDETVAAVRQSEADIAAGRELPLEEAIDQIRRDLELMDELG